MMRFFVFVAQEYISRTHLIPELVITLLFAATLFADNTTPYDQVLATVLLLGIVVSVMSTTRLFTSWQGSTVQLYVLRWGRWQTDMVLASVASSLAFVLAVVLFVASTLKFSFPVQPMDYIATALQASLVSMLTVVVLRSLGLLHSFAASTSMALALLGFFSPALASPTQQLMWLLPTSVLSPVWLKAIVVVGLFGLIRLISRRTEYLSS